MCKIYPGIEFDPVEDGTGQNPRTNFFDMDPATRWEMLRRGLEDRIPSYEYLEKIRDNKDPTGD